MQLALISDQHQCKKSDKILKELENIDDEADQLGIAFVKIIDEQLAEEYSLTSLPTLVYYRKSIPIVYEGKTNSNSQTAVREVLGLAHTRVQTLDKV